jgi:hypothetical protein
VYLVLTYVPGVALDVLPPHEHVEVARRLTGSTVSTERAALVLEQCGADNGDFYDLTLVNDEAAWSEALRGAYSPRAFDELMRLGHIEVDEQGVLDVRFGNNVHLYVQRAMQYEGRGGLSLLQHLERTIPHGDILCCPWLFVGMLHVTYPPITQYLLHRLLDADDSSFEFRKRYLLGSDSGRLCLGDTSCPLDLYVFHFLNDVHRHPQLLSLPLFRALVAIHPRARALVLHFQVQIKFSFGYTFIDVHQFGGDVRPLGTFGFVASTTQITYETLTCDLYPELASWVVDDWLTRAHQEQSWAGLSELLGIVGYGVDQSVTRKLIQGVPEAVLIDQMKQTPKLLQMFYAWPSVPACLLRVPFDTWQAGLRDMPRKTNFDALRFFGARQRQLLRS